MKQTYEQYNIDIDNRIDVMNNTIAEKVGNYKFIISCELWSGLVIFTGPSHDKLKTAISFWQKRIDPGDVEKTAYQHIRNECQRVGKQNHRVGNECQHVVLTSTHATSYLPKRRKALSAPTEA